jgi:ABC-type antimicrobial peptide transport system permease subunit
MLGTLGLGAVVLRGVLERRAELALLTAVGYRPAALAWLVLAETGYLLIMGLATGSVSAMLAVMPHLLRHAGEVPILSLATTLLLVLAVGLMSSVGAVLATLRTPLLPALRSE